MYLPKVQWSLERMKVVCKNVRKIIAWQGNNYTKRSLIEYPYLKRSCKNKQ